MLDSKNLKISPYTLRLLKQHIAYGIACLIFAGISVTIVPHQLTSYLDARKDLTKTNTEIRDLAQRTDAIKSYPEEDLADLVSSINALYPSDEDRFSIFHALDNLEVITGVDITSNASPFSGNSFREVSIPVKGTGGLDAFRSFVREYAFKSGRFMTISKIIFDNEKQTISFTATFHTRRIEVNTKKPVKIDSALLGQAAAIKREVDQAGVSIKEATDEGAVDYSTKQNPFLSF